MRLTDEDVSHIATLARLGLTEKERESFRDQLSSILEFVEKLSEAETEGVEPMSHSIEMHNRTRPDAVMGCGDAVRDALVDGFPEREDDQLKVKAVFS